MPKAKQSNPSLHNQDLTSRLDIQKVLPSHSSSYQGCIQKVQMYRQRQKYYNSRAQATSHKPNEKFTRNTIGPFFNNTLEKREACHSLPPPPPHA